MGEYSTYILYFFIYSFLGWVCETIYCSIGGRKFVNRGFLNGPICPIYGFGAILIILMLGLYKEDILSLFIYSLIGTSVLEYCVSILLEKMFNAKWWDYSNKPLNLNGRVCMKNSILFGLMSVIVTNIIHPIITKSVSTIPIKIIYFISIVLILWLITEITTTINSLNKLDKKLEGLNTVNSELKSINIRLENYNSEELSIMINELTNKDNNIKIKLEEINNRLNKIKSKNKIQKRLMKAYPNMKHKQYHEQLQHLKEIFKEKTK